MSVNKLVCALFVLDITHKTTCVENFGVEKIIEEKHLRDNGFTDFAVVKLDEIIITGNNQNVNRLSSSYLIRRRRSVDVTNSTFDVTFNAFNSTFRLHMKHVHGLIAPYTPVLVREGPHGDHVRSWSGAIPDCYLEGSTDNRGVVSLAYCKGLTGTLTEGRTLYRFDTVSDHDSEESVLVSKGMMSHSLLEPIASPPLQTHEDLEHSRAKRAIPNTIFTTELGVFVDAATFTSLQSNYHASSTADKVYMIGIRLNAAQALFNYMQQDLGYTAKMQVKSVELWETNPAWYVLKPDSITETRSSFCTGTKDRNDLLAVDYNILFAGGNDMIGFGSISGQCVKGACAVDFDLNFYSGYITAHELGHSLGMHHDADKGCFRPDSGIMEADGNYADKWASCNKVDLETFLATSTAACLFVENVLSNQVDVLLQNIQLVGLLPGFQMTQDEYCEKMYGTNWIYREWHSNDWGVCKWHSCLNLNSGLAFGELSEDTSDIPGRICSEGHVCSGGCVTWDSVRLNTSGMTVVPGGWSEWGAASACSRSCGTGTIIRRRTCTNPRPQYSPTCPGLSFKAILCNTEPCSSDPSTKSELIVKRAGEVCSNLITAGRLGADKYTGTGKAFVSSGNAQCEAECTLVPALQGSITWGTVRYAILPDGTPCSGAGSYEDIKGYPRGTGVTSTCVQGYCLGIGCDGNVPGAGIDKCGVCQGTNSTCTSVDDKFSSAVGTNDRVELAHLPNGTKLILVYFPYPNMQSYYVELWDAKGAAKISALVNGQYDLSKTPVTVGGAQWYYYWWGQYLYTFGTITEDLYLKIVNNGASVNQGITFGYSMPLASTVTTVTTTSTSTTAQSTTSSTTAQSTTSSTTAQSTTSSTTAQSSTSSTTAQSTTQSTTTPSTLPSTTSPSTTSSTTAQSTTSSTTTPSSTPSTTTTTTTTTTASTTSMPASTLTSLATSSATPVPQPTLTSTTTQVTPTSVSTTTRKCNWGMIMCTNERCIYWYELCDGRNDCGDNSDELQDYCVTSRGHKVMSVLKDIFICLAIITIL